VIQVFEKVSGQKLPYKIVDRREVMLFRLTNTDKANTILGWKTRSTIEEASAWKWRAKIRG
jgi:UDP-glucose 4-epimerase